MCNNYNIEKIEARKTSFIWKNLLKKAELLQVLCTKTISPQESPSPETFNIVSECYFTFTAQ